MVMDMSFANQALGVEYITKNRNKLTTGVHPIPEKIDKEIARLKLRSMGVRIDTLTPAQKRYLAEWQMGT
jgi:adenosylhomocysteinase